MITRLNVCLISPKLGTLFIHGMISFKHGFTLLRSFLKSFGNNDPLVCVYAPGSFSTT